jgi:hypothetical protein
MNTPTRPLADSSTPAPLQAGFAREAANPDAQLLAQIRFGEHTAGGPDPRLLTLALPPLLGEDLALRADGPGRLAGRFRLCTRRGRAVLPAAA